jgi:tRNA-specific 2-thiouridylase
VSILVALSGGVDSAVAAALLVREGLRVEALFMRNWEEEDPSRPCPAEADAADAAEVARILGIPFHRRDFAVEYWESVFARALEEFRAGRTPNPDVLCNREIKFGVLLEHARALGIGSLATGHHARIARRNDRMILLRGADPEKDQSYFLHALSQEQLEASRFPIGHLRKSEIRRIARELHLRVHDKPDSTGICFVGERRFRPFLERFLGRREGEILSTDGTRLGQHPGVHLFTLGQRAGLGGLRGAAPGPWYVLAKDVAGNRLYVAQDPEHPWLQSHRIRAARLNWIAGSPPATRFACSAKLRYRQPDQSCIVEVLDSGEVLAAFEAPQRAVTPGQFLVLYDGEECLGGGIIVGGDAPGLARYGFPP